eukprot:scaffold2778_cov168-Amphora_coffeaeformis.AAC.8
MRSPSNSTVRFKWSTTARPTATKYEVEDVPGLEDLQIADETDAKKCLLCERNAFISLPTTTIVLNHRRTLLKRGASPVLPIFTTASFKTDMVL